MANISIVRTFFVPVAVCAMALVSSVVSLAQAVSEKPAAELVARVTPSVKDQVKFKLNGIKGDQITISGSDGALVIEASDVRRLVSGYGWYLKNIINNHISWNENRLSLPKTLPAPKTPVTIESPWKVVFAYNYCTLSYTAAFWDWNRWQKELDFLALNGFSHVLVMAGLEKVWQDFLASQGYPKEKISQFIPNPAFSAWWNMGNLEGNGCPLSQKQIDSLAKLGRMIVARTEQLGMTPVLQGYVGFVPSDFEANTRIPGLNIVPQGDWCGFKRPVVVDPTCSAFNKLAAAWYKSIAKVYGIPGKAFGGDLFHEGGNKGNINVRQAAASVQSSMQKASPGSVWVIQAWHGNPTDELLSGLNPKYAFILSLCKNMAEGGKNLRTFSDIPWVWCELSNFGGNTGLYGGLPLLSRLGSDLEEYRNKGLIGLGVLSEGLETNPLHYTLFCDRVWTKEDIKMDDWLKDYAKKRYGRSPECLLKALKTLESSIYSPKKQQEGCTESIICARPGWNVRKASTWSSGERYYTLADIVSAARGYLAAADENPVLMKRATFRYDLADVIRQALADAAFYQLQRVKEAYDSKNESEYAARSREFLSLMEDMDALLSTEPQFLLGTWQSRALGWGNSKEEKALMDRSAKLLITTWINQAPHGLNDYSNRQWAGLISDFYYPRWKMFFDLHADVLKGKKDEGSAQREFSDQCPKAELAFTENGKIYPTKPTGDMLEVANRIMQSQGALLDLLCKEEKDSSGQNWDLKQGSPLRFDVTESVMSPGVYTVNFQWKDGTSALKIHSVKLYEGDKEVASDVHEGWTGVENRDNTFTLDVKQYRKNLDSYTLKAEVSGASSTDARGEMKIKKAGEK